MLGAAGRKPASRGWGIGGRLFLAGLALAFCSPALGQSPAPAAAHAAIPAPGATDQLFTLALATADAGGRGGKRNAAHRAGIEQLRQLLRDHPQNGNAHLAALAVIEDGRCETDAGYPDCAAWAIRNYELFLQAYPYSSRRSYVLKQLATNYLDLSFRFEEDKPWQSAEKAELCLGRALQFAELLAARPDPEAAFGRDMAGRIRTSGKAFSIVPGNL